MEVYSDLSSIRYHANGAITIGMFDGIHLGHQALIQKVKDAATRWHGLSTVISFSIHPQLVLAQQRSSPIQLLTTIEEKIEILARLGIDRLILIDFTKAFSQLAAARFIEEVLLTIIGFKSIVVGANHRFGRDRSGNFALLEQFRARYGFEIQLADLVRIDQEVVSSTTLRQFVRDGLMDKAQKFLGRNYVLVGKVIYGEGRGRQLHFPTANIQPLSEYKLIPKDGVYAVRVRVNSRWYLGALSTGMRPTFTPPRRSIEVYLLDFQGNLYDATLKIEFLKRLRDEIRFATVADLIVKMQNDVELIQREFSQQLDLPSAKE
jgi:riboflavin kinase/FMN adenylyltransferase